jgi:PAS domain S-box-containing protein
MNKGEVKLESQNIRKDKTIFSVEANFKLLRHEGKPIVFVLTRDITHHKLYEEQIQLEKENIQNYLNIIGVIMAAIDKQGKIILINKKGNEILGYTNGELLGKDWFDTCLPPENRQEIKRVFIKCITGRLKFVEHYENYVITKSGEKKLIFWHNSVLKDKSGNIVGSLSSGEDITERKKMENDLSRSRSLYTSIVENSNDGIVILQDGRVKFFNSQMYNMVGYTEVEAYSQPFTNFIADRYKELTNKRFADRIAGKKVVPRYEIELLKKNNELLPVEINSSLINFEDHPAVLSIVRDMKKAKEVDKMKSEFVSVASHQLRTPLTSIKWFAELLLENKGKNLSAGQKDYVDQIAASNTRMIVLVDDLLDVSHIEAGEKYSIVLKKADLADVIAAAVKEKSILAQNKKITIELSKDCRQKTMLKVDKSKMSEVFINLLDNAIKYTKQGGKIEIGCQEDKLGVTYCVKDNGVGIPAHQLGRLFERFFRAENVVSLESGTGLGLYIAKYIVDKHQGRIWCESKINQGTTFYIFLPKI